MDNIFKKALLLLLGFSLLWACDKEVEEVEVIKYVYVDREVEASIEAEAEEAELSETDVFVTGTLVLSNLKSNSLALNSSNDYALNCVTFNSAPSASKIDVSAVANGRFSFGKTLGGFAGVSFGCFLLESENILSPIIFSGSSSILSGAGKIDFDLSYNSASGSAAAIVNEKTSTALSPEKISSALEVTGAVRTDMSNFSGTYKFSCEQEDGITCNESDIPQQAYFSTFTNLATQHVAVWKSKQTRDLCMINGGTEKEPSFYMQLGDSCLSMIFENTDTLNTSFDNAFEAIIQADQSSVEKQIADTVYSSALKYNDYKEDMCNLLNTESNCKLVLGEVESYTYQDYYTNENITYTYPKWYSNDDILNNLEHYTGDVITKQITCSTHWSPNIDICPSNVVTDDLGQGQYESYFGTDVNGSEVRLRLVCAENLSSNSLQSWAAKPNLTDSVAEEIEARGCAYITTGFFAGQRESVRAEVRNKMSEITARSIYRDSETLCDNFDIPSDFNFLRCSDNDILHDIGQLDYVYWEANRPSWITSDMETNAQNAGYEYISYYSKDWSEAELCRSFGWQKEYWGLVVNQTTGLIENVNDDLTQPDGVGIDEWSSTHMCPDYGNDYAQGVVLTYNADDCQAEFLSLDLQGQIKGFLRYRIGDWDPIRYIACSDQTAKSILETNMNEQCLPQANLEYMCDSRGNCSTQLRCYGTEGGLCYDKTGKFIGRIDGRVDVMNVTEGVDGAFSMESTVSDEWIAYDHSANDPGSKLKACSMTNETIFSGQIENDDSIYAYFKQRFQQICRKCW